MTWGFSQSRTELSLLVPQPFMQRIDLSVQLQGRMHLTSLQRIELHHGQAQDHRENQQIDHGTNT